MENDSIDWSKIYTGDIDGSNLSSINQVISDTVGDREIDDIAASLALKYGKPDKGQAFRPLVVHVLKELKRL